MNRPIYTSPYWRAFMRKNHIPTKPVSVLAVLAWTVAGFCLFGGLLYSMLAFFGVATYG